MKALIKTRKITFTVLSPSNKEVISSKVKIRLVRHDLLLVNKCWLFQITFLSILSMEMALRIS